MQVLVNIPDELAAKVQARGFALETCLRELMEEKFSQEPIQEPMREGQRRQAVEAMRGFAESHGATLGGLDLKSMVHEGHKY
jgi:hypothetical protein